MARPRKNVEALCGAYTKDALKERTEQENNIKGKADNLVAPNFIKDDEVALDKFNGLVDALDEVGLLTNVDIDLLAVYANTWSIYVKATRMLAFQPLVEEVETKNGSSKMQNPYVKTQLNYAQQLMKISSLFGLSPADRSKIAHLNSSEKEEKSDPLLELLSGLKK